MLARFKNGLLYCFIRGHVTSPSDLIQPSVWKGVARRLGQWHAVLPLTSSTQAPSDSVQEDYHDSPDELVKAPVNNNITPIRPRQPGPNLWTVIQKWILALPVQTEEQRARQKTLQTELERTVDELDDGTGIGEGGVSWLYPHPETS